MTPGRRAVTVAAVVLLTMVFALTHRGGSDQPVGSGSTHSADRTDLALMAGIVDRMQKGEPYYSAATLEMTARGYPRSSFLNWRLPTLAVIEASLPSMLVARLALGVLGAWAAWLFGRRLPRAAVDERVATLAAGFTMLPIWVIGGGVLFMHEVWAGELIAFSLALWSRDRWAPSLVVGLAAALIRELALVYLVVMLGAAIISRRRPEAIGWAVGIIIGAGALALHAHAVAPLMRPDAVNGWVDFGGPDFVLATFRANPAGLMVPAAAMVVVVPSSIVGLWVWRHPAATRIALTVTAYALMFLCVGRPNNWYWGFLIAPVWPLGMVGLGTAVLSPATRVLESSRTQAPPRD
jgi:hypothetical protein